MKPLEGIKVVGVIDNVGRPDDSETPGRVGGRCN